MRNTLKTEEHIEKCAPIYLKTATRRGEDTVKRYRYWGNLLSNTKKKYVKNNVKQLNGSQVTEEH